jgi:hypothetical protein
LIKTLFLLIFNLTALFTFSQKVFLENFDNAKNIESWNLRNNGIIKHTNEFSFAGKTYSKPSKDSFIVLYDTAHKWNYSFNLFKKFKVVPASELKFYCTLYSPDNSDFMNLSFQFLDKNKKKILGAYIDLYCDTLISIPPIGMDLPDSKDSFWLKADSLLVTFRFNPTNPYDTFERIAVIDEFYFYKPFASVKLEEINNFSVFPNPVSKELNILMPNWNDAQEICLFNSLGQEIFKINSFDNERLKINTENYPPGIYHLKINFNNGITSTKRIIISNN